MVSRPPHSPRQGDKPRGQRHGGAVVGPGGGRGGSGGGGGGAGGGGGGQGGGGGAGGGGGRGLKGILGQLLGLENQQTQGQTIPSQVYSMQTPPPDLAGNPANALAFSSFVPGPGQVDPRDDQYWSNVSNLLFNTNADINNLNLDQTRADTDYARSQDEARVGRGQEQRALAEQAMRSGLSRSGWLDVADAEDTADHLRMVEEMGTGFTRDKADRQAAISSAIQSYLAGEGDLARDALSRFSDSQLGRAEDELPLYAPEDIQRLADILRGRRGGRGGGGNASGGRNPGARSGGRTTGGRRSGSRSGTRSGGRATPARPAPRPGNRNRRGR